MRCYWLLRSLRKAAFGGALTALGMFSAAASQAAVVCPELPSWMASPVSMKISVYPLDEATEREPLPWFSPAEGYEPYGENYVDYGIQSEDLSEIETPLSRRYESDQGAATDEVVNDSGTEEALNDEMSRDAEFDYQNGYRNGYDADEALPYEHDRPEEAADAGFEYRYDMPEESAFSHAQESSDADAGAMDETSGAVDDPTAYEHRYPAEQEEAAADADMETRELDPAEDYDYSYNYMPRYEKYGRWMETAAGDQDESNDDSDSTGDEADEGDSAMESGEYDAYDAGNQPAATMESPYETDSESSMGEYNDEMGGETSQYEHDAQDGEFCPARDEMNSDADSESADANFEEQTDDSWQPSMQGDEYGDEGSSQQAWVDEETAMNETGSADTTSEFSYVLRDSGWRRAYSGEPSAESAAVDQTAWTPDNLLTESDNQLIRDLALAYEEPLETRYAMLNDYVEMLGWEALKLAERFEDSTGIEFLGLTEDLSGLAAVLSVFRATQQGAVSLDQGVDLLCHGFSRLDQNWLDTVARICIEDAAGNWVSGDNPSDSWEPESNRGMVDQSEESETFQSDSGDSFSAEAAHRGSLLEWLEQERDNWNVAFRNTVQQFRNIDLGWLVAPSAEYEPVIGAEYDSNESDYDDCSEYDD